MKDDQIIKQKELEVYLPEYQNCLQHEPAFCAAACPFNMDVDAFVSRLQEGRFNAAYKSYRDATGFPFIAAEICTAQCEESCLRNAVRGGEDGSKDTRAGDPIDLLALERATLAYATRIEPTRYNVPGKNKSVAIIGGGISGMACALRLATKKYNVTIYEKSDRIGGTLWDEIDPKIIEEDFVRQMEHLDYTVRYNTDVTSLEDIIKQGYKDNEAAASAKTSGVASVMRAHTTHGATDFTGSYDAIYVATGKGGNNFGIEVDAEGGACRLIEETAVFLGGSLVGGDKTHALADGLRISAAIDNYTLTKLLKYPENRSSKIVIDETQYIETPAVKPTNTDGTKNPEGGKDLSIRRTGEAHGDGAASMAPVFSKEEAIEEANRCMKCQCNSCKLHCDLTDYLHKWPLRLKDEIIATTAPGKSELHATPAVRTINMCTHCGLCKDTCPEDIDLDEFIQAARVRMHKLDKMPWGFNDFFIRDLQFTNGPKAYLCMTADGNELCATEKAQSEAQEEAKGAYIRREADSCEFVYFPGCQLGASSPELVLKSYKLLQRINPSTGIMIGCCGVPAQWAGDVELHEAVLKKIRSDWRALGKPTMILACATCKKTFDKFLPEIHTTFVYDVMAKSDETAKIWEETSKKAKAGDGEITCEYSVFDPCATSIDDNVRTSVRQICGNTGVKLTPLPLQEKWTACCSYGGHGDLADPEFTKFVREKRISEGELPYITYCINCRDAFLREGKSAIHIFDLLFGISPRLVTVTKRRHNRIELKEKLVKETTSKVDDTNHQETNTLVLEMSDEIRQKLSDEYILEEEVAEVVDFCERTGRTLHDTENDTFSGYHKIGNMTYWVTYRPATEQVKTENTKDTPKKFELLNAYSHRMEIELEMIWNGKKIDIEG